MAKLEFTVEILEIREILLKKVKVQAETRGEAIAKVKATCAEEYELLPEGESLDGKVIRDDIDVRLEWPDGNPKEIKE